jgi:hypothetical protein
MDHSAFAGRHALRGRVRRVREFVGNAADSIGGGKAARAFGRVRQAVCEDGKQVRCRADGGGNAVVFGLSGVHRGSILC